MSEVAGLALGTIALASLFQNCIDLFDCFELARNYTQDHHLASVKISLLRERLRAWGGNLHSLEPGNKHSELREQLSSRSEALTNSLLKLRRLLSDSELLVQKYRISPISRRSLKLRKRTIWAVHDRAKFDRLIQDISFLIENLEKVAEEPISSPQKEVIAFQNRQIMGSSPEEKSERNKGEVKSQCETDARGNNDEVPAQSITNRGSGGTTPTAFIQFNKDRSSGTQGAVDKPVDATSSTFCQTNADDSHAFQGLMSREAYRDSHTDHLKRTSRAKQGESGGSIESHGGPSSSKR